MKTVLITGASGGIGHGIAERFASKGYKVALHAYRHFDLALEYAMTLTQRGVAAVAVEGDISDETQAREMVREVERQLGSPDVLINNAGIALPAKILTEVTTLEWSRLFQVNMDGMFHCAKAVLPAMISMQGGSIVNVSSMWGVTGGSCEVAYSSSKAAVIGFTKSLAKECAPNHIRVNCVAPGYIKTQMNAHFSQEDEEQIRLETPLLRLGTPEDVAESVYFLASEQAGFITGQTLSVDGGYCI